MSTSSPLVSILINNYNYGRFIAEAIDSALNQTYSNLEIIVVDDGSTDNSHEIIQKYEGKIIPILKENGGQASAFNVGFAASQGEIICFLDSDDLFSPEKVAEIVEIFNRYPEAEWCFHPLEYLGHDVNSSLSKINTGETGIYDLRSSVQQGKLSGKIPFGTATSAMCCKRSLLNQILPMPEIIRITSDDYIKYLASGLTPGVFSLKHLAIQRIHGNNACTFQKNKVNLRLKIQSLTAYYIKINFPILRKFSNNIFSSSMGLSLRYQGLNSENSELIKKYLASTSILEKIEMYARAMYYFLKG